MGTEGRSPRAAALSPHPFGARRRRVVGERRAANSSCAIRRTDRRGVTRRSVPSTVCRDSASLCFDRVITYLYITTPSSALATKRVSHDDAVYVRVLLTLKKAMAASHSRHACAYERQIDPISSLTSCLFRGVEFLSLLCDPAHLLPVRVFSFRA